MIGPRLLGGLVALVMGSAASLAADLDGAYPRHGTRSVPSSAPYGFRPDCDRAWRAKILDCRPGIQASVSDNDIGGLNELTGLKRPRRAPYLPFFVGW